MNLKVKRIRRLLFLIRENHALYAALRNDVAGVNAESHIANDLSQEGVLVLFSVKCIVLH